MMPRRPLVDAVIVVIALMLVGALAALRSAQNAEEHSAPSTYDTGANGYAAVYDLLAREGARVERFELPVGNLARGDRTLVVAGQGALDAAAPSPSARTALDRWVRGGGKLVVLDSDVGRAARDAFGLPAAQRVRGRTVAFAGCALGDARRSLSAAGIFTIAYPAACARDRATVLRAGWSALGLSYRRGRGVITAIGTPTIFDNVHLLQRDDARLAYTLLGAGSVAFDERVHGFAAGRSFWEVLPQPMRVAIVIALIAAALAVAGANLPFAPPYEPDPPDERDSSAYIASVARMLERGGAAREAIARIAGRCERVLAPRSQGDERARMLLRELRTLEASPRPGAHDLVHAGRIFARVRKDYGC